MNLIRILKQSKIASWFRGERPLRKRERFNDSLYTKHFLYPLLSLYPMQMDLHSLTTFVKDAYQQKSLAMDVFEELSEKRPKWAFDENTQDLSTESTLHALLEYMTHYKRYCQSQQKHAICSAEAICEPNYKWCSDKKYALLISKRLKLPIYETFPSAYEIFNHQLQWLEILKIGVEEISSDKLSFLRNVVKETLCRLFQVRNIGKKNETNEIKCEDLNLTSELVDHRINRFCDYILEEIEEICLGVDKPFSNIQERVDNAQRYIKNGMNLLRQLDKERQEIFVPLLANIVAFLESMDRVVHRFRSDEADSSEVPEEMLFLLKLPVEKNENEGWYEAFFNFKGNIMTKKSIENPETLFQSPYWAYTALGPRMLGELYIGTICNSYKDFEFFKSSLYFEKLKKSYNANISATEKTSLIWKSSKKKLRQLTGLKVNPINLNKAYRSYFRLPFLLKISFGAGLIVIAELDYGIWSEKISQNAKWPNLIVFLLFLSSFAGTFSLITGKKRVKRSIGLFMRLVGAAVVPSLLSTIIFGNYFKLLDLSFLFLVFGSIFFAVVVNTIGNIRK